MTTLDRKERLRRRRQKQVAKQKMVLLLLTVLIITIGSIVFGSIFSSAKGRDKGTQYKYFKSITIEQGDSLWSIAQEYCTDEYESVHEYMSELKQVNDLNSETIHAGQHLLVAYFDTELR